MLNYLQYNIDSLKNSTIGEKGQSKFIVRVSAYVLSLLIFIVCLLPSPYVIEAPGPTLNVLGKSDDCEVIPSVKSVEYAVENAEHSINSEAAEDSGKILLLTVSVSGGIVSYNTMLNTAFALFNSQIDIMPSEVIYPPNTSSKEAETQTTEQMKGSQSAALNAANNVLSEHSKERITNDIPVCASKIGGPSGGLAFTLGMLEKLGHMNLAKGRIIAVTGTIDNEGKVGKIGGIKQKMISAYNDGARILITPKQNAEELKIKTHIPDDLQVIGVETIQDAVNALK